MKKTKKLAVKATAKSPGKAPAPAASSKGAINASIKLLQLGAGLYLVSVKAGAPRAAGGLRLPALHLSTVPGTPSGRVEFVPNHSTNGTWVCAPGDLLVVKVQAPGAALVFSSLRAEGGNELAVKFERLDGSDRTGPAPAAAPPVPAEIPRRRADDGLRVQVGAHIRGRGDMTFTETLWAGRLGKGMWLESFSVAPQEGLTARDVEYKGLTASGFESPWMSDAASCGTRGMAIPLIGFAIRPKGTAAATFQCEYSGYFQSGVVVGPLKNGTPCRSTIPNDPLEGIQVKIFKRSAGKPAATKRSRR